MHGDWDYRRERTKDKDTGMSYGNNNQKIKQSRRHNWTRLERLRIRKIWYLERQEGKVSKKKDQ